MISYLLAPVVKLVDTQVLGTCAIACRFESDRGQGFESSGLFRKFKFENSKTAV